MARVLQDEDSHRGRPTGAALTAPPENAQPQKRAQTAEATVDLDASTPVGSSTREYATVADGSAGRDGLPAPDGSPAVDEQTLPVDDQTLPDAVITIISANEVGLVTVPENAENGGRESSPAVDLPVAPARVSWPVVGREGAVMRHEPRPSLTGLQLATAGLVLAAAGTFAMLLVSLARSRRARRRAQSVPAPRGRMGA